MRSHIILALAAVSSAFVLPSEEVFMDVVPADRHDTSTWYDEAAATRDRLLSSWRYHFDGAATASKNAWKTVSEASSNAIDTAMDKLSQEFGQVSSNVYETAFDAKSWLESQSLDTEHFFEDAPPEHHHRRPGKHHDGPDDHKDHKKPPHHKRPHHPPHHHHDKPNATVYELINGSKYTTKLAFLINEYPDLVDLLNSTKANYTVFAPTNAAFEKIPEHAPKPSKEQIKALLTYHVVPDFYPAGRVLVTHTVPTLLTSDSLGSEPLPQRLSFHVGLRGLTVNFYSRIIGVNFFATNGVIHAVDSLIIPPPRVVKIIDLLPAEFSTLELGLAKTGLLEKLNTTDHNGGTLFAPSNRAFEKLGPRINAFLFSKHGLKYLKALLEYHVVPDNTLYSDALYTSEQEEAVDVPKGKYHLDLPTLLKDKSLSVDIFRWGGFITIKINGFSRVVVEDGIAKDGVIQVVGDVLIPPKKLGGAFFDEEDEDEEHDVWRRVDEELDVDEFKARLEPLLKTDL